MRRHRSQKRRDSPCIVVSINDNRACVLYPCFILLLFIYATHRFIEIAWPSSRFGKTEILILVVRPFFRFVAVSEQVVERLLNTTSILTLIMEEVDVTGIQCNLARGRERREGEVRVPYIPFFPLLISWGMLPSAAISLSILVPICSMSASRASASFRK